LSYIFWGTSPDAMLRNAADANALGSAEQIEAQARRLLADERSRPQVARFFTQWLGTRSLQNANKDLYVFPHFNEEVRAGLIAEEEAFVEHVVFDGTGQFPELFAADYVFANQITGAFYGLSIPPAGSAMELVGTAQNPERGGLLTLGSVLASHAHSMETSPVKRGVMVRERILCQELLPPPLNVDTTPPGLDPSLTTRERFGRHTADPTCNSCHRLIDSIGFGFEQFDGVGAFRTEENGIPVDGSGEVAGLEAGASEVTSFNGPRELSLVLAESPTAQACLARQFAQFARGFHARETDACVADIAEQFQAALDIQELMVSVAQSPSFLVRSAGEAAP
jgi:hypothetical protein